LEKEKEEMGKKDEMRGRVEENEMSSVRLELTKKNLEV
jgi:hypothetical protein